MSTIAKPDSARRRRRALVERGDDGLLGECGGSSPASSEHRRLVHTRALVSGKMLTFSLGRPPLPQVLPNRTDQGSVVLTENALPRTSESLAEGNGSIGTVVADLQRLVPGWNVVENGPLDSYASASPTANGEHLNAARTLVFRVVSAYWEERLAVTGRRWPMT